MSSSWAPRALEGHDHCCSEGPLQGSALKAPVSAMESMDCDSKKRGRGHRGHQGYLQEQYRFGIWDMEGPPGIHTHIAQLGIPVLGPPIGQHLGPSPPTRQASPGPVNQFCSCSGTPSWGDTAALFSLKEKLKLLNATLQSCSILPHHQCWAP